LSRRSLGHVEEPVEARQMSGTTLWLAEEATSDTVV
jgi:hypothetical protein